jgi:hypothetical protein
LANSCSYKRERKTPNALFYVVIFDPDIEPLNLLECEKRTADFVVFTDCPPGPEEQKKSTQHHSYRFASNSPLPEAP